MKRANILYIHPHGHLVSDDIIPSLVILPRGTESIVGIDSDLELFTELIPPETAYHELKEINLFASATSLKVKYGRTTGGER